MEPNPIVLHRCKKLKIPCLHDCVARKVTEKPGGFGAVREVADWLLKKDGGRKPET